MWMSTPVWLSSAVLNVSLLRDGIVVLRGISVVITPPSVSRPRLNGVTSSSSTSVTSPPMTPACKAAPIATTSSGFTLLFGSLPVSLRTSSWTIGIRVAPPTRTTSSRSPALMLASCNARLNGSTMRCTRPSVSCSNFERVRRICRCFGPFMSAVMKGRLISVSMVDDSSTLAFSAASRTRCNAWRSCFRSMP